MANVFGAYERALEHLRHRQKPNGALAGEVLWNPMLVCQFVITCHIVGREISPHRKARIRRYLEVDVRPDGGWGMYPGSPSWLFHTVLGYVALRLLGAEADDPLASRARTWIHDHGGVHPIPTWGRVWLALLGLYPWTGVQPILPEMWLLPEAAPMHPRRLYNHMRLIYLGLSYAYGRRITAPTSPLLEAIRGELYPQGYRPQDFEEARDRIAPTDLYEEPQPLLRAAFSSMRALEKLSPSALRERALARALEHVRYELHSTNYVCLSPVNGLLFCLALHVEDPTDPDLARALDGVDYWVWDDEENGLRVCGARSDIWDTSFALQALCEGPRTPLAERIAADACRWLQGCQMQEELVGWAEHHREPAYGGWGFADEHHPWPVSDCTAEALEALIACERAGLSGLDGQLQLGRKLSAIRFILQRRNDDGGFGSYEPRRGSMVLRQFNPAEIYGNCMLEYSYTECTGSCVRGLAAALEDLGDEVPPELRAEARAAIDAATRFILSQQHASGGWLGFWGINLTYGSMFAVTGLLEGGLQPSHPAVVRAVQWLADAQRADGGWGESAEGLLRAAEVHLPDHEPSLVVQTAWALLTLLAAAPHERELIDRGVAYLVARQGPDGSWPREVPSGCFFNTAVLEYELYRQHFPAWALARYLGTYGAEATVDRPR